MHYVYECLCRAVSLQEARAREAEALARAQSDAKIELERTQVEIKVKDKVLEQQQREIQALKVRMMQLSCAVHHAGYEGFATGFAFLRSVPSPLLATDLRHAITGQAHEAQFAVATWRYRRLQREAVYHYHGCHLAARSAVHSTDRTSGAQWLYGH